MAHVEIKSEYSAQPSTSRPNPLVHRSIEYLAEKGILHRSPSLEVADQGCGKLRHLLLLAQHFKYITLVDTPFQLARRQTLFGCEAATIAEYVSRGMKKGHHKFRVLSSEEFAHSDIGLDVVFNLCTMDVVTMTERIIMFAAAYRNLNKGGHLVLVVPRNDQSILVRCNENNKFGDGHIFMHHGAATFYKNFRDENDLIKLAANSKFEVVENLSNYRQVGLILRR